MSEASRKEEVFIAIENRVEVLAAATFVGKYWRSLLPHATHRNYTKAGDVHRQRFHDPVYAQTVAQKP